MTLQTYDIHLSYGIRIYFTFNTKGIVLYWLYLKKLFNHFLDLLWIRGG